MAVIAIVVFALWAAACGGDDDTGQSGAQPLVDIAAAPRHQVKVGGTLRWPLEQWIPQFNFNNGDGASGSTNDIAQALLPYPFDYDEHARVIADPNYLTSAEVATTGGRQVVTLTINPKAAWSDGRALTWEDFQAQWKALRGTDPDFFAASSTGYDAIAGVEMGADEREVVITFDTPFGEWQSLYSPLYPKQATDTARHFNTAYLNRIPVTAGPFKVDKLDSAGKTLRIVRDPSWWGNPAKLDAIAFSTAENDAQVNAFANGEVDRVLLPADASAYKRASSTPGGVVRTAAGPSYRHFTINGSSPLLKDVEVRRSVAMAIDRAAIAKADLTGLDWPNTPMSNHFFVNTQDGYADNSGQYGRFDPERARRMLDAAGWKPGGTYRKKGAKTLKLRFVIPSGLALARQDGELAQAMLKDVGIELEIVVVSDFYASVTSGDFDITPFIWTGNAFPLSSAKSVYVAPKRGEDGEIAFQQNFPRVGSPEIDRLMTRAEQQLEPAKARDFMNQADKLIWDEVHTLILFQEPQNVAVTKTLVNIGAFGFKTPVYEDMGFRK